MAKGVVYISFRGYNKYVKHFKEKEGIVMAMISLEMPENPVSFAMPGKEEDQLERNAMILYPYIRKDIISHGKAAEILGILKWI